MKLIATLLIIFSSFNLGLVAKRELLPYTLFFNVVLCFLLVMLVFKNNKKAT